MGNPVSGETSWRRSRIVVPVASPAAGSDWSITVPGGHVWTPRAVFGQLATSAVVATRSVRLTLTDGVRTFLSTPPTATQAASLSRLYSWLIQSGTVANGLGILSVLLDWPLQAGWTIGTTTEAIDVGDAWTGVFLLVEDTTTRGGELDFTDTPDFLVRVVEPGPS